MIFCHQDKIMKLLPILATAALAFVSAGVSSAATLSFDGNTLTGSTFHRPTGSDYPAPSIDPELHYIENGQWSYHSTSFTVGTSGNYDFSVGSNDFDIYLALYTSFDPSNPTANLVALFDGDDSSPSFDYSSLLSGVALTAGETYTFVVTSFWENTLGDLNGNTPAGQFQATITGPGTITAIPEPSAVMLGSLAALAFFRRRR